MRDVCVRARKGLGLAVCLAAAALTLAVARAAAEEPVMVQLDRATVIKLPERAATVVIGDPLIADVSLQPGGLGVITGKSYGATNVIVLDKSGAVLAEHTLEVEGPAGPTVVVYRGVTRQTYSCTPDCERRITIGDTGAELYDGAVDKDYFAKSLEQATGRNAQATAAGAAQQGH